MPFGLQLKSLIVGIILAWFIIPWLQAMVTKNRTPAPSA